jgi:hypothetical protein
VFCIYNIIAIIDGLIYFDQGSRLLGWHAGLIAVGTVILLGGVFALSWRLQSDDELPGPAAVDIRAKSRVPTPRTALTPGMGILNSTESDDEEEALLVPDDEEASRHPLAPSETTPLLRTTTDPAGLNKSRKRAVTLRVPKLRRLSTINDTNEIWDELNDRSDSRRFSGPYSPHSLRSPSSSRIFERRSGNGTRRARTMPRASSLTKLSTVPWRFWEGGPHGKHRMSLDSGPHPTPLSDHTDGEDTEGESEAMGRRRRGWSLGGRRTDANTSEEQLDVWMKLKWWKKRWRKGDDGNDIGDGT